MKNLLFVSASPRGENSAAIQAANIFIEALPDTVTVTSLNLFEASLPEISPDTVSAKFKFAMGADMSSDEAGEWQVVTRLVEQFVSADLYLFAIPMWNFNVPYKMKQYIDLVTHPGMTFTRDEKGIRGLASGGATVIYSRGGNYSPKDGKPDPFDFQSPYMKAWLGLVGLGPITEVLVQNTMAGPDALAKALDAARDELVTAARAATDP